jgi:hypothetical protein
MAAGDIWPARDPYGGNCKVSRLPVNTTATFLRGEPVAIEAAGTLIESASQPDPTAEPSACAGIALASAADVAFHRSGSSATPYPTTMLAPVAEFSYSTEFITRNLFNGSDVLIAPALANIGDKGGLRRAPAGDVWGFDIGAAAFFEIKDVLDALKRPVRLSGGTGVYVVFARCEE